MSDLSSIIDKFKTVFILWFVVGIGLAGWSGAKLAEQQEKYSDAYMKYEREVIANRVLSETLDSEVKTLVTGQSMMLGHQQAQIWAEAFSDKFLKKLEAALESSEAKKDFDRVRDNSPWWLYLFLTVAGVVLALASSAPMYRREKKQLKDEEDKARVERERTERIEQERLADRARLEASRARAENRR